MRLQVEEDYRKFLFLVCLHKVYHDAGKKSFEEYHADYVVNNFDYYYEFIMNAMWYPAPIVKQNDGLYRKYRQDPEGGEVNLYGYSNKSMQEYYRIARKLHRLEGNKTKENPYIKEIERKLDSIRGFHSYNFDYDIGNKRKGAQIEVQIYFEFDCEIALCLWIVRCMTMFEEELPKLREKYRKARREKRSRPKQTITGGVLCAA